MPWEQEPVTGTWHSGSSQVQASGKLPHGEGATPHTEPWTGGVGGQIGSAGMAFADALVERHLPSTHRAVSDVGTEAQPVRGPG